MLGLGSSAIRGGNTQPMLIPSTNYYLKQLQRADGSKFVDKEDDFLWARFFRFMTPRSYDSQRFTYRLVQGFRGDWNNWDWDSAIVVSAETTIAESQSQLFQSPLKPCTSL